MNWSIQIEMQMDSNLGLVMKLRLGSQLDPLKYIYVKLYGPLGGRSRVQYGVAEIISSDRFRL